MLFSHSPCVSQRLIAEQHLPHETLCLKPCQAPDARGEPLQALSSGRKVLQLYRIPGLSASASDSLLRKVCSSTCTPVMKPDFKI